MQIFIQFRIRIQIQGLMTKNVKKTLQLKNNYF